MKATATLQYADGWWAATVTLGDHTFHTQGRNLKEVQAMVADVLEIAREEPELPNPDPIPTYVFNDDVDTMIASAKAAQNELDKAQAAAKREQLNVVHSLQNQGFKLVDIAELLGLSKGRISQLAKS